MRVGLGRLGIHDIAVKMRARCQFWSVKLRYERTAEPEALKKGKARAERQKGGKKRGKGEGKGKGGKGGKSGKGGKGGKGGPGMKARPGKSPGVNAADEFAS